MNRRYLGQADPAYLIETLQAFALRLSRTLRHGRRGLQSFCEYADTKPRKVSLLRVTRTLMETYLGRDAGERVLRGRIVRGIAERIDADRSHHLLVTLQVLVSAQHDWQVGLGLRDDRRRKYLIPFKHEESWIYRASREALM